MRRSDVGRAARLTSDKIGRQQPMRILILICALALLSMAQPPKLPDESAGIDGIAQTLISAFDHVDIVALGERHLRKLDSDVRIALVRHPEFARKVRSI